MAASEQKDIIQIFRDGTLIDQAMNAPAVRDAVQLHKEKGLPLVVCRDGKILWVSPARRSGTHLGREHPATASPW